jgi:hypothetical protein
MAWNMGVFERPLELARRWQQRKDFGRMQKALIYYRYTTAILLAHETGLFEALTAGSLTPAGAGKATGLLPQAADSLLRILAAENLVREHKGRFELTEFARDNLTAEGLFTATPMLDLMAAQAASFGDIPHALATGEAPKGLNIFYKTSRYKAFLKAVNMYLDFASKDLLAKIDLPPIENAIVGSMGVSFSAALLKHRPEAQISYGCLAHLTREIPNLRRQYGVPMTNVAGTHAHGGDPFADKWGDENFDLVFLTKKMILNPAEKLGEKFAAKAFEVLQPGGMAIFWETIHPDQGRIPLARAMEAVLDLGAGPAGKPLTESGVKKTLRKIGFADIDIVPAMAGTTTFITARKAGN